MLGAVSAQGKGISKCLELFLHREKGSQNAWSCFCTGKRDLKMLGAVSVQGKGISKCLELLLHREKRSQNAWSYFCTRKRDLKMLGAVSAQGRSSKNSFKVADYSKSEGNKKRTRLS
ncbi:hypothetical protein [Ancylomarina longa]|uniref:Uncharacterized protein n=1 Tax=Ancylomarina longa TaxID=2487017 RepID=A0A434AF85_9BACT|nr:hypothetical protein [Ancylomarina longa]RUT73030.1 hypothetical protein DLK05_15520 [Ancylomarina longa]